MIKILHNLHLLYIILFFALLAGLYVPFVNGIGYEKLVVGIIMLLFGLYGGTRLYDYAINKSLADFQVGIMCICISMIMIYIISGVITQVLVDIMK